MLTLGLINGDIIRLNIKSIQLRKDDIIVHTNKITLPTVIFPYKLINFMRVDLND